MKTLTGNIASAYKVAKDGSYYSFSFKTAEGSVIHDVKDRVVNKVSGAGMLPSYAVYIVYKITIDNEEQKIIKTCEFVKRQRHPLKVSDVKKAVLEYSPPETVTEAFKKSVNAAFKGKCKQVINSIEELESVLPVWLQLSVNRMFHCYFQPTEYYKLACYLDAPRLLDKDEKVLKDLQSIMINRPWQMCFLSASTYGCPEYKGLTDMSIKDLKRWCSDNSLDASKFLNAGLHCAVYLYRRWYTQIQVYGSTVLTIPKDLPPEHRPALDDALSFLKEIPIVENLTERSYYLQSLYVVSCSAVIRALLTLYYKIKNTGLPPVDCMYSLSSSHASKNIPVACIRSIGSNYYSALKHFLRDTKEEKVLVLCPTKAHLQRMEQFTEFCVLETVVSAAVDDNFLPEVLVIDASHIWDVADYGRALKKWILTDNSAVRCLVVVGDERELCGLQAGSVFEAMLKCKRFPILHCKTLPNGFPFSEASFKSFRMGLKLQRSERRYDDITFMTQSSFAESSVVRSHCRRPFGKPIQARFFCNDFKTKKKLQPVVHGMYDSKTDYDAAIFSVYDIVYVSTLKRVGFIDTFVKKQPEGSEPIATRCFKLQREFRSISAVIQSADGDSFEVPLTYEMGIQHALLDVNFRMQAVDSIEHGYMFIDENSAWKAVYTLFLKCTSTFTLVVPDSYEDRGHKLLNVIIDNNWRMGRRNTVLAHTLCNDQFIKRYDDDSDTSQEEEEGEPNSPKAKRQKITDDS